jgi:hypothetical protein
MTPMTPVGTGHQGWGTLGVTVRAVAGAPHRHEVPWARRPLHPPARGDRSAT